MLDTITIGGVDTRAGRYTAVLTPRGLARLDFPDDDPAECARWLARWARGAHVCEHEPLLDTLAAQLDAYFAGQLREFSIPLDLHGTPFQLRVWAELCTIDYGERRSYGAVAAAIGAPRACRAVGAANGANPVPILVPCHRLIGADGGLIKYGGGLARKRQLLELESGAGA